MTMKVPAVAGVTAMSVDLPGKISLSTFSALDMNPWMRSVLVSRRITGSPFLSVIWLGENSYFFALISITSGLTPAWARLVFEATATSAIAHAAERSVAVTILFLNIRVFII